MYSFWLDSFIKWHIYAVAHVSISCRGSISLEQITIWWHIFRNYWLVPKPSFGYVQCQMATDGIIFSAKCNIWNVFILLFNFNDMLTCIERQSYSCFFNDWVNHSLKHAHANTWPLTNSLSYKYLIKKNKIKQYSGIVTIYSVLTNPNPNPNKHSQTYIACLVFLITYKSFQQKAIFLCMYSIICMSNFKRIVIKPLVRHILFLSGLFHGPRMEC